MMRKLMVWKRKNNLKHDHECVMSESLAGQKSPTQLGSCLAIERQEYQYHAQETWTLGPKPIDDIMICGRRITDQ
jgi:hypothetical protein